MLKWGVGVNQYDYFSHHTWLYYVTILGC